MEQLVYEILWGVLCCVNGESPNKYGWKASRLLIKPDFDLHLDFKDSKVILSDLYFQTSIE
jgi:hypothetical protein